MDALSRKLIDFEISSAEKNVDKTIEGQYERCNNTNSEGGEEDLRGQKTDVKSPRPPPTTKGINNPSAAEQKGVASRGCSKIMKCTLRY